MRDMSFETYKGIEFIRISALPEEERVLIRKTLDETKIIKILRERELLNDCIQVSDYSEWKGARKQDIINAPAVNATVQELKLAFK
jgi:hypothetical protein